MVIAGEPSGDLHGAGLVREMKSLQPSVEVFGMGGDGMANAGMEIVHHFRGLSFMGFTEVLKHLPRMRRVKKKLERTLAIRKPDVLVLIDYPGFNLRFARKAKAHGTRIFYYISPQVWAWGRGRVSKMKGLIEKMFVVFPFEVDIYRMAGIPVEFVGHPLLEVVGNHEEADNFRQKFEISPQKKLLGLFPGSRPQEVERILPVMAEAAVILQKEFDCEVGVGVAPNLDENLYRRFLQSSDRIKLVTGMTYRLMKNSDLAFVASGTATLETACFGTPMVVVYRTSIPSYLIGRILVKIKNISLVNIVAGQRIVPELIQAELTPENLAREGRQLLSDESRAQRMRSELLRIREKLGSPGASRRVAEAVLAS